jgi:bla regulator protein BlaR1
MEYLLKVSAIVAIFYFSYKLFLQRNTFFEQNRWFLLIGLATAFIAPLFVIPIYLEYTPVEIVPYYSYRDVPLVIQETEEPFNILNHLPLVYFIGIACFSLRFLIQLASLSFVIHKNNKEKNGRYTYVKTNKNTSPFSFFYWIVYNPTNFTEYELEQIITHEKVHASQKHSIDILLTQLSCIVLWFNPFIWLYNNSLKQNLEFIADKETQRKFNCKKSYQTTLLKTSMPSHQMALTNNFYTSLIKKRIVMLHKSKSKKINLIKYAFVIPLLAVFLMSFNTEEVYIETHQNLLDESNKVSGNNIDEFLIYNTFSDIQFKTFESELKNKGYDFQLNSIQRTSNNLITSIDFVITKNGVDGRYRNASGVPLDTIVIEYFKSDNKFIINQSDFLESQNKNTEKENLIQIVIDKNTTAKSLEKQKKILKETYDVDINFEIVDQNDEEKFKTYSFKYGKGKNLQGITTTSERPHVFLYNPKTNSFSSYTVNKNGDPEYGHVAYLEHQKFYIISKNYTDASLNKSIKHLKENSIIAKFTNVKRNDNDDIIAISISAKSKNGSIVNYNQNTNKPIDQIAISYYGDGHGVKIGPSNFRTNKKTSKNKSNTKSTSLIINDLINKYKGSAYFINGKEITEKELKLLNNITIKSVSHYLGKGKNGVVEITTKTTELKTKSKNNKLLDSTTMPKSNGINPWGIKIGRRVSTDSINFNINKTIDYSNRLFASKKVLNTKNPFVITDDEKEKFSTNQPINITTIDGKTPLYVVDGEVITKEEFQELNPNDIASIAVLKDEAATSVYGDRGKNGVVMIATKNSTNNKWNVTAKRNTNVIFATKDTIFFKQKQNITKQLIDGFEKQPLYILDGKEVTAKKVAALDDINIESVSQIKDSETAIKKFGQKAKNGVVEISMRSKNSKTPFVKVVGSVLYIVDGKEMKNEDFEKISPNEIVSFRISKSKNDTNAYGNKAKNGVVFITTKKN